MQTISERMESMPSLKMEDHSSHIRSCTRDKHALHPPACGFLRCSSDTPSSITARELDSDLGLWQALPQELFPCKRTSNHRSDVSSREEDGCQQPTSPGVLSVTTAPSDGGTIRLGRPAAEPSMHSISRGPQVLSHCAPQEPYSFNPVGFAQHDTERAVLSTQINDAAASPVMSHSALSDLRDLQQPSTCLPLLDSATCGAGGIGGAPPGIPIGGAALNAVPECNSSLETPDSHCLNRSNGRMPKSAQSVMPFDGTIESCSESPDEQIDAFPHRSVHTSAGESGSDVGCTVSTVPYRTRGSSMSSTHSARSQSRRKSSCDAAPTVQYGFQSPTTSYTTPSTMHLGHQCKHSCTTGDPPSRAALSVGSGPPRKCGLLSVSLSQCASQCTSPQAVSPTVPNSATALSLPSKLARLSVTRRSLTPESSASSPRSSVRSTSGGSLQKGSLLVIPSCSPVAPHCGRGGVHQGTATSTASDCCSPGGARGVNSDSPVSTVSAVIPPALQMQMMTMGYHRPSRVITDAVLS